MECCGEDFICPPCSNELSENAGGVDCTAPSPVVTLPSYAEVPVASFRWNDTIEGTVFLSEGFHCL